MSLEKAVPMFLRHNEVERGGYGQNAPIRYAPDPEMKSDVSDVTNLIVLPGKTKTYLKTWNGRGSNELVGCIPKFLSLSKRSVRPTHALTISARYLLLMGDLSLHPLQSVE
jgi:hypothetical protein